jgi:hypothetical protein
MVTVFIQYTLDPFKIAFFEEYANRLKPVIPRCGGTLVGYFLPHEGANNAAYGVINLPSLAEYEAYRKRLTTDEGMQEAAKFARDERLILAETRTFLRHAVAP